MDPANFVCGLGAKARPEAVLSPCCFYLSFQLLSLAKMVKIFVYEI